MSRSIQLHYIFTDRFIFRLLFFPFLENAATIGDLVRELPQCIAATQGVVIECEGNKVEWWKVHEEGLRNWSNLACSLHLSMSSKIMHSRTTCKQAFCCSITTVDKLRESLHLNKPCLFEKFIGY